MNFRYTREFERDMKKLSKRYRSLDDDLLVFQRVVSVEPVGTGKHFAILTVSGEVTIVKARFFCKSLKKKDLRIIYAYRRESEILEFIGIEFIELYFKGDKSREDQARIDEYLGG